MLPHRKQAIRFGRFGVQLNFIYLFIKRKPLNLVIKLRVCFETKIKRYMCHK